MDANYFSNEPYAENPIEVVAPTDTTGSSAYAYHYTLDGSVPDESDPLFTSNITLNYGDTLKVKRYGIGSGNNKYHPSPVLAKVNYFPKIVLEECCNLYDQLVWEGNTDKINTFWNNKPLNINFFIKKIHDTYFLYIDPFDNWYRFYDSSTTDRSNEYSPLDFLYCKSLIFYSKDLKTWLPLPGFENDFSSPVEMRGKISSKYALDIYYFDNKFHILYINIDANKFENFITTNTTDTTSDFGNNNYQRIPNYGRSIEISYKDFEETGGLNSTEEVNLYELVSENVSTINENEGQLIYQNLENLPEFSAETSTSLKAPFYLDSRLALMYARASHIITNNRIVINLSWPGIIKDPSSSNVNYFYIRISNILLEKIGAENFKVRKFYNNADSSAAKSSTDDYPDVDLSPEPLILPSIYSNSYYIIPFIYGIGSSSIGVIYTKNFTQQDPVYYPNSNSFTAISGFPMYLNKLKFDKNNDLYLIHSDYNIYNTTIGYWGYCRGYSYNEFLAIQIPILGSYYQYGKEFYLDDSCFYIYLNKNTQNSHLYTPSPLDSFICKSINETTTTQGLFTYLPEGYTFLIHDAKNNNDSYLISNFYNLGNLDGDNFGYLSLFNSEGEPVLFKIHLENPAKQTEENQISTMSLDDKKIYRLQTRRINIEENKESTTNETQPLTTEQ